MTFRSGRFAKPSYVGAYDREISPNLGPLRGAGDAVTSGLGAFFALPLCRGSRIVLPGPSAGSRQARVPVLPPSSCGPRVL